MVNSLKRSLEALEASPLSQSEGDIAMGDATPLDPGSSAPVEKRARESLDDEYLPSGMMEVLEMQMGKLTTAVTNTLSNYKPTGAANLAWATEWKHEKLFVSIPVSGINVEASLIDQVFLSIVLTCRSKVKMTAGLGWDDIKKPSAEDEKFLVGVLGAISGDAPSSLKCGSSSGVDLAFYTCWNLAAAHLVNDKEARGSIHPAVLPDKPIANGKASGYLAERIRAFKATLGLDYQYLADTLERLIKLWASCRAEDTRSMLLNIKIPWNLVLSKGAEYKVTEQRKGRVKSQIRQLKTPTNPKESAWLLQFERKPLAHLCAPIWSRMDKTHDVWRRLKGEDTHVTFESNVAAIKLAYKEMHRVSDSMLRKLGFRKAVVLNHACVKSMKKAELAKTSANSLAALFAKQDLTKLSVGAKAIFDPLYVCSDLPEATTIITWLEKQVYSTAFTTNYRENEKLFTGLSSTLFKWAKEYYDTFQPTVRPTSKDIPKDILEVKNQYAALGESSKSADLMNEED